MSKFKIGDKVRPLPDILGTAHLDSDIGVVTRQSDTDDYLFVVFDAIAYYFNEDELEFV